MDTDPDVNKEAAIANSESQKLSERVYTIKIRKDADMAEATNILTEIKRVYKNIETRRKGITSPLRQAIKNVDDLFKDPLARLKDAEGLIKDSMIKYTESVEKRAANRADKLESQVDAGELKMSDAVGKLSGIKQAETNVKSEGGSASIKTVTRIRIIDPSLLPAKYFLRERVLEALRIEVEEDVRKRGEAVPTGAEKYEDKQVAVRTA